VVCARWWDRIVRAKAIMLSVWIAERVCIDLWTKEMPVDEMKIFFHQTLVVCLILFFRATGDEKMADTMKDLVFCREVRIKTIVISVLEENAKLNLSFAFFL
jgi:gliding motility-associated protein GldC